MVEKIQKINQNIDSLFNVGEFSQVLKDLNEKLFICILLKSCKNIKYVLNLI